MKLNTIHRKKVIRALKLFLLVYSLLGIALYYGQELFLFHPVSLGKHYKFSFKQRYEEVFIPVNEVDTIHVTKFLTQGGTKPKGLVLYFHGNERNVEHYAHNAAIFTSQGWELWMQDYPGFGKSTGEISEENLYTYAKLVRQLATHHFSNDSIIIYGRSLGSGIAANVAANSDNKALVLETPYYSIPALFASHLPIYPTEQMSTYKIPTASFLTDVKEPVIIFHGTSDFIIPYRNARLLQKVLKPGDTFVSIPGGRHNNLSSYSAYKHVIDSMLTH